MRTSHRPRPDLDAQLIELWNWRGPRGETLSAAEIGRRLGITVGAVTGLASRLRARGHLEGRPSPLILAADDPRRVALARSGPQPLPPGARTIPPLPSERRPC